jgi:hypothetical protein
MNWEAVGAVGEILGAAAVVATLVYLAAQIRQNTHTARSATRQAITDSIVAPPMSVIQDRGFREAFLSHINAEEITAEQNLQLQSYCYITMHMWENIHYQSRSGLLSAEEWDAFRRNLKAIMQIPVWVDYWRREKDLYTDAYNSEIASILIEIEQEPTYVPDSLIHGNQDTQP